MLNHIVKILDLGTKFIPNFFVETFDIFLNYYHNLSYDIINFNSKLFFYKPEKETTQSLIKITEYDPYADFFKFCKSQKTKSNISRIPIISESLNFQIHALKNISEIFSKNKINLNSQELFFLKKYCKEKPFVIVQCDKNIGTAIMSHENHILTSEQHLADINIYKQVPHDPLNDSINHIEDILRNLYDLNEINSGLLNNLIPSECKLGVYKMQPKLHKKKFGTRPLINSIKHPTSRTSLFLNKIMQPFVRKMESFLLDSQNLLQKCNNLFLPPDATLIVADFEALYTNIDHNHAIVLISDFMKDKLNSKYLSPKAFKTLLQLVLENNYFTFNFKFYLQIKGVAMGTIVGPTIANLYIYLLETKWQNIYNPFLYSRFIDDLFLITTLNNLNQTINSLKTAFGNLNLNIEHGQSINFLDLQITIDSITNTLDFSLYVKPTNTFSFLLTSSNHPSHIYKNIPKSLFIRIRRNNTKLSNYLYHARAITFQLMKRGYHFKDLRKISNAIANLDRDQLLHYKSKMNRFSVIDNKTFLFKKVYDNNFPNINNALTSAFNSTIALKNEFQNTKLRIINRMQFNLGSILIQNFKIPFESSYYCSPCRLNSCSLCQLVNSNYKITIKENCKIPIISNSNCKSKNCIYVIYCKLCHKFYVGRTHDLKLRIMSHIYSIQNFKIFITEFQCVPFHFKLKNHNIYKHFSFFILESNINDINLIKTKEAFYINYIYIIDKKSLLNDFIPQLFIRKDKI